MTIRLTEKEAALLGLANKPKQKSKYHARKIMVDGIYFDSEVEADYYCYLKFLQMAGEIDGFCRQARFLVTNGTETERGTEYVVDFVVFMPDRTYKIIDVKGVKTDAFKLKMKDLREKYPKLKVDIVTRKDF